MKEVWKKIEGFDKDYEVSSKGRFKRFLKSGAAKVFEPKPNGTGYPSIGLVRLGVTVTFYMHQLVAEAFLGHKIGGRGMVVDHKSGNKLDNSVTNLQLVTFRENLTKDRVNKTGFTGVRKDSGVKGLKKLYCACIYIDGKYVTTPHVSTPEEAGAAYKALVKIVDSRTKNK